MEHVPLLKPLPQRPVSQQVLSAKKTEWGLPVNLIAVSSCLRHCCVSHARHHDLPALRAADRITQLVRDQLTVSSWLAVGACFQCLLFLAAGRIAFVPAFLLLFYRIVDAALITNGVKANPALEGVVFNKFAPHFPDAEGKYRGKTANRDIVVFHIGARCNQ